MGDNMKKKMAECMLTRTPRGRCVTRLAYEHLHMAVPKRFDDEDSGQTSMF